MVMHVVQSSMCIRGVGCFKKVWFLWQTVHDGSETPISDSIVDCQLWTPRRWRLFSYKIFLLKMKLGFTTTGQKRQERERKGAISPHWHERRFPTLPSARRVMLTFFWDKGGAIIEHCIPNGEYCHVCHVHRSTQESSWKHNQIHTMLTYEYMCLFSTWQCSTPCCLCNGCDHPGHPISALTILTAFTRPRPK